MSHASKNFERAQPPLLMRLIDGIWSKWSFPAAWIGYVLALNGKEPETET